ncbi:tRNA (guanine(10)-N(2))-dimethyltransferase [Candidatus Bathyarchaeota archaeon]|nr:tRNA (guanine(10)-N(2))-dimethyltransferase [Candidatus Bathyarchaeota archaeon]
MQFDFPCEVIREGEAVLAVPKLSAFKREPWEYAPCKAPVFYNPVMRLNRDIAVIAVQVFQEMIGRGIVIAEPLAGSGVRGIRFALEVDGVEHVYMNDINPLAHKMADYNVEMNGLRGRVTVVNEDANLFLSRHSAPNKRFDFIDLDPFGSPVCFLDSAIRALKDGGLLALTATDMAPLCGIHPRVALRKYGGLPLRTEYCHEIALRLLIGALAMTAAKYETGVKILFSHKTNHYVRAYAQIIRGAGNADKSIRQMGYILHCFSCFYRETVQGIAPLLNGKCSECGSPMKVAGPLWLGRLSDAAFCERMENKALLNRRLDARAKRIILLVKAETDAPATYFVIDKISDKLGLTVPSRERVMKRLVQKGFRAWLTHFHPCGIKTDAPAGIVVESVRQLAR